MGPKIRLWLVALSGALLLTTACTGGSGEEDPEPSTPSPQPSSLFDRGINIAAKFDQPGFNYKTSQKYAGFEKDLADFLSGQLHFPDMRLNEEPSIRREEVLTKGTAQLVIATYSITDEREKKVDFAGPYVETKQGMLVRKDDDRIDSRDTAAGKTICTAAGSTADEESAKKKLAELLPKTRIETRKNYSECVQLLQDHNIDAVWTDLAILYGYMERYDDVEVVKNLEIGAPQLYGVGIQDGSEKDCEKLAGKLRLFVGSPRWRESFENHFPELTKKDKDFEQHFKPDPADIDDYSCRDD
jgi:glutamate transport system substrate-binding protein